ncbi:MAG TPA: hypothetical protein VMI55_03970 [Thermoplasmata archaeon]|nr:hypothetical protein [Thermoplasmata archaeon]
MKGSFRVPVHPPPPPSPLPFPDDTDEDDEERFVNRPCYEFDRRLGVSFNDRHCRHCRHYLTARCPHIDEFLEDVEDLSPE